MKNTEGPEIISGPSDIHIRDYWEWSSEAICKRRFEIFDTNIDQAKFLCSLCPVAKDCLIWAIIYGEDGIWGETTKKEREKYDRDYYINLAKQQGQYYQRISIPEVLKLLLGQSAE